MNNDILKKEIEQSHMLFVVPAGNEGMRLGDAICYPAMYDLENVISVAALRADGELANSSNFSDKFVDVAAPGADILTLDGTGCFVLQSGTSFAVPFVVAKAVMERQKGTLPAKSLKKAVLEKIVVSESLRYRVRCGGYISFED